MAYSTPYSPPTLTGYNSSPPADDGRATSTNAVRWSTHKSKIGDPLRDYSQAISSAIATAFTNLPTAINLPDWRVSATSEETSAGVTPLDMSRFPSPIRDISRYVSDNTGASDVSAEFQDAVDANKHEIVVPDGIYLASFTIDNDGQWLRGGSSQNVVIYPANNSYGIRIDAQRVKLSGLLMECATAFTGKLIDADGVTVGVSPRRLVLHDIQLTQSTSIGSGTRDYTAASLLSIQDDDDFTGYNDLQRVRTSGGKYGAIIGGSSALATIISVCQCSFNRAGYFGLVLYSVNDSMLSNFDASNCGQLLASEVDRTETFGGIKIYGASKGVTILQPYFEGNPDRWASGPSQPNDFFVDSDCQAVRIIGDRTQTVSPAGNLILPEKMGSNDTLEITQRTTRMGSGGLRVGRARNVLPNSYFRNRDSSDIPIGWTTGGAPSFSYDTADCPSGFDGSLVMTTASNGRFWYPIFSSGSNRYPITNIANWTDRYITGITFIKLTNVDAGITNTDVRLGIADSTNFSGQRLNFGYVNLEDVWVYIQVSYQIQGDETALLFGFDLADTDSDIKIAGCALALGPHCPAFDSGIRQELMGEATYDPANLADGAGVTTTVTVTGARLGDFAVASFSLNLQGITLTAYVSASNTVAVRFQNETGGAIDLGSGTITARVLSK